MFPFTTSGDVESAWSQNQKKIDMKRQETETVVAKVKRKVAKFLNLGFWDTQHTDAGRVVTTSKSAKAEISSAKLTVDQSKKKLSRTRNFKRKRVFDQWSGTQDEKCVETPDFELDM